MYFQGWAYFQEITVTGLDYGEVCCCLVSCAALESDKSDSCCRARSIEEMHHCSITYKYKLKSPPTIRSSSYKMAKSKAQDGSFSCVVVSPSLLAKIDASNHEPKRRFLFGLGKPFEPNPWDISDSEDDEKDFLMHPKWPKRNLPSRNHSHQIGGVP